ncbi:MAG: DUF6325 family protein [Leptolyngbyaceae cyanobacterium bins.302]|nr:DUF6325 family protein [Leptolyngbyaceae cyanobacterium bins.302]
MSLGPVEILCIKFPNTFIKDEIAAALKTLVNNHTIRIIDILFIRKNAKGEVTMTEIDEMDDVDHSILDPIIADISGLIAEEDVQEVAAVLDNNSFAALMLFEHVWATAFRDAVLNAQGELLFSDRIPSSVIEAVMATSV